MSGTRDKVVVLGILSNMPVAGIECLTMPYVAGFQRLGFDAYYVEAHANWPRHFQRMEGDEGSAAVATYLDDVLRRWGMPEHRWAYHALHSDNRAYGLSKGKLERLYHEAALILNLHAGTWPLPEEVAADRLVLVDTDPVGIQVDVRNGDPEIVEFLRAHGTLFTWGENFYSSDCGVPMDDRFVFRPTRMPITLDTWVTDLEPGEALTTVGNWEQGSSERTYEGDLYTWSKHHEFLKILDLPQRTEQPFELALSSADDEVCAMLRQYGWRVRDGLSVSTDLDTYRDYIAGSRGEFTVAKDQNVRLRSGWFSDRSASYLAAGRPVITQDTGFGNVLPTGEGLFAFSTADDALAAVESLNSDYARHSRAALEIAREYFAYDRVLGKILDDVGLAPGGQRRRATSGPRRRAACTIVSKNYLPYARVLASSFREHHPEIPFFVLLVDRNDGLFDAEEEPFELVEIDQLPIPDRKRFCFQYSVVELNTAAKPYFLEHLFEKHDLDQLLYFDPDILVVRDLGPLWDALESSSILLVPHLTDPVDDGLKPTEIDILRSGTYNLGFLGLRRGQSTDALLGWWQDRLYDRCLVAHDEGLFTDQRWIDLVPGLFDDVRILREPGYNVAYWNYHGRTVEVDGDGIRVNGQPAYFFHFSGFDPDDVEAISKHQNRFDLASLGDLRSVFERYGALVRDAGWDVTRSWPYAFGSFDNGVPIPEVVRSAYLSLGDDARRFGDPFDSSPPWSFYRWLRRLVDDDATHSRPITNLWYEIYAGRADLRDAYPDVFGADRSAFLDWAEREGAVELDIPAELRPSQADANPGTRADYGRREFGVNLAGYLRSEKGMGEAARSDIRLLEAAGIPHVLDDFVDPGSLNREVQKDTLAGNPYAFNVVHVNADEVPRFVRERGGAYFADRYNIGYWTWELEDFPAAWRASLECFDEIWVPSTFVQDAVSRVADRPVLRMPHAVDLSPPQPLTRAELGLPENTFLFLFAFDFHSYLARKNPRGLIEAFRRAFDPGEPVTLVLKCSHSDYAPEQLAALREQAAGLDVRFVDAMLDRERVRSLMTSCDAYVSLHRSEGFGLTLAEAMALGKPVVATGYSGNLDFMTASNSFLVPYHLVELAEDEGPYSRGSVWSDPDLDEAARLLRQVVDSPADAAERAARGRADVTTLLAPQVVGERARQRLEEIYARGLGYAARPATPRGEPASYGQLVRRIRRVAERHIPTGATVAVVSKGDPELLALGNRRAWHFPRNDNGTYPGFYPSDGAGAMAALERVVEDGAEYLIVPAPADWWLSHYEELGRYLEQHANLVHEDAACRVFRLVAELARPAREPERTGYDSVIVQLREHALAALPHDATVLVVSRGDDEIVELNGCRAWHFPTAGDGEYAGHHPADSRDAITRLEEQRARGAEYLVIPKTAYWWLGYYSEFAKHLLDRYRVILSRDECLIFDLSRRPFPRVAARLLGRV
jgi:glycosyltransferase involved in cell wall biosynthesis